MIPPNRGPFGDRIAGRTALITGAGNGLGRAITLALASQGARVILVGRTDATLRAVAEEVTEHGGHAHVEVRDTANTNSVDELARQLQDESVSILINNAGIAGPVAPLTHIEPEDWDEVMATNVRGVYLMCRAFIPPMVELGAGDIINIASVTGKRPLPGRTPYAASKMAIIGLTVSLAHEVGVHGVMVNSLSPGPVSGARMARVLDQEARRSNIHVSQARRDVLSKTAAARDPNPNPGLFDLTDLRAVTAPGGGGGPRAAAPAPPGAAATTHGGAGRCSPPFVRRAGPGRAASPATAAAGR